MINPLSSARVSSARAAVVLTVLVLSGAACTATTTVAGDIAVPTAVVVVAQNPVPVEAATPAPAAPVAAEPTPELLEPIEDEGAPAPTASQGLVQVVFDDGRSWTLDQTECMADPDRAVGLLVEGVGEGTLELNVISTRALSEFTEADAEQIFIASFVDDEETLYVFEDPATIETGADGSISFVANLHSNIWYAIGDAPAVVATISC